MQYHEDYCRRLGLEGIELYNGSGGAKANDEVLRQFTRGMSHLDYILADFTRHSDINPSNSHSLLDNTVVFHTLTQFKVWGPTEDFRIKSMANENAWLVDEIKKNSPTSRPGFMTAQAASWSLFPRVVQGSAKETAAGVRDCQSRRVGPAVPPAAGAIQGWPGR